MPLWSQKWCQIQWYTLFPKRNATFKNLHFFWGRVWNKGLFNSCQTPGLRIRLQLSDLNKAKLRLRLQPRGFKKSKLQLWLQLLDPVKASGSLRLCNLRLRTHVWYQSNTTACLEQCLEAYAPSAVQLGYTKRSSVFNTLIWLRAFETYWANFWAHWDSSDHFFGCKKS